MSIKDYIIKRRLLILFTVGMILICFLYSVISVASSPSATSRDISSLKVGYRYIHIKCNDTLWDIAKENFNIGYDSIEDYIDDIKKCNNLTSDNIKAGSSLVVPVYTDSHTPEKVCSNSRAGIE